MRARLKMAVMIIALCGIIELLYWVGGMMAGSSR